MTAASGSGIPKRDEDSGLHDIKNLASSQRMRLSRRSTQNPIIPDDDVLASSSAGWKAVALPEPARMVSLPELAELPSKAEVKAREKAQKAAEKAAARESKKELAAPAPAVEAPVAAVAPSVAAPIATAVAPVESIAKPAAVTPIGSRVAAKKSGSSTKILAIAGIGLAAAAGVTIFVMTNRNSADKATPARADSSAERSAGVAAEKEDTRARENISEQAKAATPAPAQIAADDEGKDAKKEEAAPTGARKPSDSDSAAAPPPKVEKIVDKPTPPPTKKAPEKPGKAAKEPDKAPEKPTGPATIKPDEGKKTVSKGGKPGEPDFDALLKEAGVKDKSDAPKLEKKQLTMGEFKTAMAGITGVAQKCYAGTSGTALVRVSIAPTGKITGVQVTGAFAGTPVGTCVENAVRGLTFPAWDGPPQSFGYSYLLAE